jgi:hypothetical protein
VLSLTFGLTKPLGYNNNKIVAAAPLPAKICTEFGVPQKLLQLPRAA